MASLHRSAGGMYRISFRYQGKQFLRSLETDKADVAQQKKALIERTLQHLKDGVLNLPDRASPNGLWQFLRSGGKSAELAAVVPDVTLEALKDEYLASFGQTGKEASTLKTEAQHLRHVTRLLSKRLPLAYITVSEVRRYVARREAESGRNGRTVQPVTIAKELQTLRQLWEFGKAAGYVSGDNPVDQVAKPRRNQKPPFMTREEIERRINRGGLTSSEMAELWQSLFLRESEIGEFLQHVKHVIRHRPRIAYVYPALAFCAYTGARRSEMLRCRVDDVSGAVFLREKKKTQEQRLTFREVPLHRELNTILRQWSQHHPGGQLLFCKTNQTRISGKTAREAFMSVTKDSKWRVLHGYHVLRHSFASNLARHGVDQYKIDAFMGHQTEEMRQRYRHLFPEDRQSAIAVLSFQSATEQRTG